MYCTTQMVANYLQCINYGNYVYSEAIAFIFYDYLAC